MIYRQAQSEFYAAYLQPSIPTVILCGIGYLHPELIADCLECLFETVKIGVVIEVENPRNLRGEYTKATRQLGLLDPLCAQDHREPAL